MISIIIPVFNEENRLRDNIEKIFEFIGNSYREYEVIIVDDGSKDSTQGVLLSFKKKYPIKILTHRENTGKGAAIRTGFHAAQGDLVLFTDIDLSVPIYYIGRLVGKLTKNIDLVIGTREVTGAKIEKRQFFFRELSGKVFTVLANLLLGVGVSDFTCGFKLFRKKAALIIFSHQKINRWAFDAEILYLARKYNLNIREVPVTWRHNTGSKVRFPGDIFETFVCLFRIRLNNLLGKYD